MAKKHYEIIKRIPRKDVTGIRIDGRKGEFKNNIIRTTDAGLAREIRQSIGQDRAGGQAGSSVLVAEVPDRSRKITSSGIGPGKWKKQRWQEE